MGTSFLPEGMHEFQNSYLHLIVDEEAKLLYSEWTRNPSSREYHEAAVIFAGYLREKGIRFWIQDTNRLGEVPHEDLKAIMNKLVPIAVSSHLSKLARITSDERSMNRFEGLVGQAEANFNSGIEVQQFKTYREAAE